MKCAYRNCENESAPGRKYCSDSCINRESQAKFQAKLRVKAKAYDELMAKMGEQA